MAGYDVYFGEVLFPVAPDSINMNINGKNTVYDLINEGEMNILKYAGLTTLNFQLLLPSVPYPFATYLSGFQKPSYYLEVLEKFKQSRKPFQLLIARRIITHSYIRGNLHNTDMKVSIEDYKVVEKANEHGMDFVVDVSLKQYKEYKTKTFKVDTPSPTAPIAIEPQREEPATEPEEQTKTYTITVYYSGSSGSISSVSATSTVSVADARTKAWAKVPKTALWASETKKQATNQDPPLTDAALEAARRRVQEQQQSQTEQTQQPVKKPTVNPSGNQLTYVC